MSDFIFNRAKGRFVEFAERVNANDPANAVFEVRVINTSATDATLKDLDTMAEIQADANTAEVNNSGYAKKVLADGALTITYDDGNDRVDVDFADQTWTSVAAGTNWTDLLVLYDSDSTLGDDTNIIPISQHDFVVTPDGCLPLDALVMLNDHPALMADVQAGAYAFVPGEDGLLHRHKILAKKSRGLQRLYRLQAAGGREIRATANHPFKTEDGWKRVDELTVKSMVAVVNSETREVSFAQVQSIVAEAVEETWDLEVEGAESFVANGFHVHNSNITAQLNAAGFARAA